MMHFISMKRIFLAVGKCFNMTTTNILYLFNDVWSCKGFYFVDEALDLPRNLEGFWWGVLAASLVDNATIGFFGAQWDWESKLCANHTSPWSSIFVSILTHIHIILKLFSFAGFSINFSVSFSFLSTGLYYLRGQRGWWELFVCKFPS